MIMTTTGQLTARDWATYRCVASNDHGDSAASVTLTGILPYHDIQMLTCYLIFHGLKMIK